MRTQVLLLLWGAAACTPDEFAAAVEAAGGSASDAALDGVVEVSHTIFPRLEGDSVVLTVTRGFHNRSDSADTGWSSISIPRDSFARSLRAWDGRQTASGELVDDEVAVTRWEALVGTGSGLPTTLAMLSWESDESLGLRLQLGPHSVVWVEYQLSVRPELEGARWVVDYPLGVPAGQEQARPVFELGGTTGMSVVPVVSGSDADADADADADSDSDANESAVLRLRIERASIDAVEGRWATHRVGREGTVWRIELDAAARLEPLPVRPRLVFVIDASHSQGPEGIAAQLELIAPLLLHVPEARVEVIVYRRFAERLFGRLLPAKEVSRALLATPPTVLAPGNGSHLERGVELALAVLQGEEGPARVLVLTDEAVRFGFDAAATAARIATLPSGAALHLVARSAPLEGELVESREDDRPLSALAQAGGGVFLRVEGRVGDLVGAARALEGLLRPVRIDGVSIEVPGVPAELAEQFNEEALFLLSFSQGALREGGMVRAMGWAERLPPRLVLRGRVWAREFSREVLLSRSLRQDLPGLYAASEAGDVLDDELLGALAFEGGAVSRVTSLIAAPLAAEPSSSGGGTVGTCSVSTTSRCGRSFTIGSTSAADPEHHQLHAELASLLEPALVACRESAGDSGETLEVEVTGDEVVEVKSVGGSPHFQACASEAAWALRLPPEFKKGPHRVYALRLGGLRPTSD